MSKEHDRLSGTPLADAPEDANASASANSETKSAAGNAEPSNNNPSNEPDTSQTEDAVMKSMMQFFADELLPVFGVTKKVKSLAPTEQVHIEIKKGLQDFNMVMEDNSIAHFEFQSTNGGTHDLRRFRSYESTTSYQLAMPVTTYVLILPT